MHQTKVSKWWQNASKASNYCWFWPSIETFSKPNLNSGKSDKFLGKKAWWFQVERKKKGSKAVMDWGGKTAWAARKQATWFVSICFPFFILETTFHADLLETWAKNELPLLFKQRQLTWYIKYFLKEYFSSPLLIKKINRIVESCYINPSVPTPLPLQGSFRVNSFY